MPGDHFDVDEPAASPTAIDADVSMLPGFLLPGVQLPNLLRLAAAALEEGGIEDADTARLVDALLGGGLPAVRAATSEAAWVQLGIETATSGRARLYCGLAETARCFLGNGMAQEFFFVHKPPGLRVRFQCRPATAQALACQVAERLSAWQDDGVITRWQPAVYEPESYLFGGPVSMRSVHRIFTADSLVWLDYHGADAAVGPGWAVSLLMIRELLQALSTSDWEDVDVWDRLCGLGRRVSDGLRADALPVSATLRRAWADPDRLWGQLDEPAARRLLGSYTAAVHSACQDWQSSYFGAAGAYIGPREAAAMVIVFHWNRADLSPTHQAVIAEALRTFPG